LAQVGRVAGALRERADARAHRLVDKLEHFVPLVEQGIDQAVRRVLQQEQVPAFEKVLSLFEEHTMIITRRKVGKPREFGRKVLLDEVEGAS
jgi:transposase, IS5 family